jgi:hypothetical protein
VATVEAAALQAPLASLDEQCTRTLDERFPTTIGTAEGPGYGMTAYNYK